MRQQTSLIADNEIKLMSRPRLWLAPKFFGESWAGD